MSITVNPIFPIIGAQSVAPDIVLQPGTVVDATVQKVVDANLVRIAIANLSIEVLSEVPLKAGQALQLAVSQTPQGVKLAIVPKDAGAATPNAQSSAASLAADPSNSGSRPATDVAQNIAALRTAPPLDAQLNTQSSVRPLTNLEAFAVSAAVQSAAAKQGSLAPLFANLSAAASSQTLPPALQEAAARLLSLRPGLNGQVSGDDIKAAFEKSGLFLERSLASRPAAPSVTPANQQSPDLKAALIVFRQTVASWLDETPATTLPPDGAKAAQKNAAGQADVPSVQGKQNLSSLAPPLAPGIEVDEVLLPGATLLVAEDSADADPRVKIYAPNEALPSSLARTAAAQAGLSSLQEVLHAFPKGVRDAVQSLLDAEANLASSALRGNAGRAEGALPSPDIPPPPFRGSAPSAQPVAQASLALDAEPVVVARHLIDDTDAALARQTLLQVASLPERIDIPGLRSEANAPRWNFEIPFATPQGTAVAQFEISRDGEGISADPSRKTWRARFSLNVEPSGPVHALVTLSGERTSVRMWAERPSTAAQLRANAPQLTHALREAALEPGDIVIGDGAPPQPAKPPAGHFLDRAL